MRSSRGLGLAVLLCLLGAFVVLVGAGREWASVQVAAGALTDAQTVSVAGTELAGGVRGLGLVGLAGVVALAATRRVGRVVVGALLLLTGAGVVATVVGVDLGAATLDSEAVGSAGGRVEGDVATTAWPWLTALGGVLLAAAGLLTVARGRSWPGLGQRYEAPAAREQAAPATPAQIERSLWEALDRGEDPTAR